MSAFHVVESGELRHALFRTRKRLFVEPGVLEGLVYGYAATGIRYQQLGEQIYSQIAVPVFAFRKHIAKLASNESLACHIVRLLVLFELRPRLFVGASHSFKYEFELFHLRIAFKQLRLQSDFSHDTAYRPHVHLKAVSLGSQQQFWRSVPHRDDFLGERSILRGKLSGKTEVTDLEFALVGVQQIRGLEVPMDDVAGVQIGRSFKKIPHELFSLRLREGHVAEQILQLVFDVLHDNEHFAAVGRTGDPCDLGDVRVAETAQDGDLPQRSYGEILSFLHLELLDCANLAGR